MLLRGAIDVANAGGRLPDSVEELTAIPGIGRYTAGAIASIAYDRRAPIVDGNVARILARLFGIDAPAGSTELMRAAWIRSAALVAQSDSPRMFNQGLMEIGALVCKPKNPECERCPLVAECVAFASSRTADLPAKKRRGQVRALTIPLYFISDRNGRVLMRRESGDLMTAMYHLPHGESAIFDARPLPVSQKNLLGTFRHTVTNRRIEFRLYAADLNGSIRDSVDEYAWIDPADMQQVPHPSYVAKALAIATVKSHACAGG
jgi:A/G-specific adenine glycosylase